MQCAAYFSGEPQTVLKHGVLAVVDKVVQPFIAWSLDPQVQRLQFVFTVAAVGQYGIGQVRGCEGRDCIR